jgi:hypothetical protein
MTDPTNKKNKQRGLPTMELATNHYVEVVRVSVFSFLYPLTNWSPPPADWPLPISLPASSPAVRRGSPHLSRSSSNIVVLHL